MFMKKSALMLILGITILTVGCGKEDVKTPHESQIVEDSNVTMDSETDSQAEAGKDDVLNNDNSVEWNEYMVSIKEQSDGIKYFLENDAMTQMDMNTKSQELYELWDGALNYLWSELKGSLSEEEFSKLQDEQRKWIAEKEISVEEAGKEVEGGSMYSLVVNMEAAKLTEERVYELYELLK